MMRPNVVLLLICCLLAFFLPARGAADENADLNLIPKAVETEPAPPVAIPTSSLHGRIFLEDALTERQTRTPVVADPAASPRWQNRTSLDIAGSLHPSDRIKITLSDRANFISGDTVTFLSDASFRNDFREGYISWEVLPKTYLEAGRINVKYGIALGYNPTDFFKSRTTVDMVSIDPSALREDRLGSLMVIGQKIWDKGAITLAFSPKVTNASPLDAQAKSLDPLFSRTNSANRALATVGFNLWDLNPQILFFVDHVGTHVGINISRVVGQSIVTYAEWSAAREASLTDRAVAFGKDTGTLPQGAPLLPQTATGSGLKNDLAVGASWTSSFNLTINLEYHYHQAGFDSEDFDNWVALGRNNPRLAQELWYIRQYASDQQEPLMQQEIFLRFAWQDILPSKLNAGLVMFISPYDGSVLAQASAQYFVSRNWTIGLYLAEAIGSADSVEGSLPWSTSGVIQLVRYF